jgi:hypothetical protein
MALCNEHGNFVPLKSVTVEARIVDLVADVTFEQVFINESFDNNLVVDGKQTDGLEIIYKFPMDDAAVLYNFQAVVDDVVLDGQVRKKEEAETQYNEAMACGKFGALVDDEETDVFQIRLGNFKQRVAIRISYHTMLKYENGKAVFFIPTTIAPRYNTCSTNFSNTVTEKCPYKFSLTMECSESVSSPSHEFTIVENKIVLKNVNMDRDIVFYIETPFEATATYQQGPDGNYVGMISYIPCLNKIPNQKTDLIFLVDRSGSMNGKAIEQAKEALNVILHSIPEDSYFNIVGFGSTFSELFEGSIQYSEYSLKIAKEFVQTMDANLGGTEIFAPLQKVLQRHSPKGYQKQIFVLTDGEVANVEEIIALIKNCKGNHRIFSLGLGSSACHYLVNSIARVGHGTSMYASLNENLETKILTQLQLALQPSVTNVQFEWKPLKQVPSTIESVFRGNAVCVFGMFGSEPDFVTMYGKPVSMRRMEDGSMLARLAAKQMIQELGFGERDEIIKLGLAYNIATKYTSFVAVGNNVVYKCTPLKSVRVANQMSSVDSCSTAQPLGMSFGFPSMAKIATVFKPASFNLIKHIIDLQNFDGSFNIDNKLKTKINYSSEFSSTAFVLAYLEMKCMPSIDTWRLVAEKARNWLRRKGLEQEVDKVKIKYFST